MDVRERITALADLMQEFRLAEARLQDDGLTVAFRRRAARPVVASATTEFAEAEPEPTYAPAPDPVPEAPKGTPITSPMNGIYYRSPSPSAPPFVREGDTVTAGQIIGLIEAMKVFNEIPATASGTVLKVNVESGQLVQPGETLILVG